MQAVLDERVRVVPRYAKGYLDWLSEKRDWPVSRQLWWGHRIPIWSRVFASAEEMDRYARQLERDPQLQAGRLALYEHGGRRSVHRQHAPRHRRRCTSVCATTPTSWRGAV